MTWGAIQNDPERAAPNGDRHDAMIHCAPQ